jgi:Domain of unknown function (DUF4440)
MLPAELRLFFQRYAAAFNALDGGAVAQLYAEPSAIAQGGKVTVWATRSAVAENMVELCTLYRKRQYKAAHWELGSYLAQGGSYAIVDLRWSIHWQDPAEPWKFSTTYNLAREPEGWSIILCTAYEEDSLHQHQNVA